MIAFVRQVSSPVRWEDAVRRLAAGGVTTYVEATVSLAAPDDLAAVDAAVR